MFDFKPSNPPGDLVDESSDDLEGVIGNTEDSEESDVSDDSDNDDIDAEDVADVGEESGKSSNQANPFFEGSESDVSDTEDESDMEDEKASEVPKEEEDDLIKALKAAREKKTRTSPPDIKTADLITDISFHPESDVIAVGNISGDLSVFQYGNEGNTIQKKLKLSKKTLRGLEFDDTGSSLLTISKDKTFRILDTETWTVK